MKTRARSRTIALDWKPFLTSFLRSLLGIFSKERENTGITPVRALGVVTSLLMGQKAAMETESQLGSGLILARI